MKYSTNKIIIALIVCTFCTALGKAQNTMPEVLEIIHRTNNYWQTNNSAKVRSFWDPAAYHTGNMEAYFLTGNPDYRAYSEKWSEYNLWMGAQGTDKTKWTYGYDESANGVLFGDWQICFQTYVDLYNIENDANKIARATEVMEYQMSTSLDAYWWWADGLYMVMPVMTKMYKLTDNNLYLDKLYEWYKYAKELMYDGPGGIPNDASGYTTSATLKDGALYSDSENYSYLFYRDANYVYPKSTINGIKNFWARGDGWVFAGLAKVLQDYPNTYPNYNDFLTTYREMANAIIASQKVDTEGNGFWTQSMLANYPLSNQNPQGYETSGTAFFTYGLFWGINNGLLDSAVYYPAALKAWNYLAKIALHTDGKVGYVQPIGAQATQATPYSTTQNFGVGAFLLASCEYYRFLENKNIVTTTAYTLTQSIDFTARERKHTFFVRAFNLTDDVILTAPTGLTLSKNTISKNDFNNTHTVQIDVTYDAQTQITADTIFIRTVGAETNYILITADATQQFSFPNGLFLNFDQSINPRTIQLGNYDLPIGVKLIAPQGITLSTDTLSQAQMEAGALITATWDESTTINKGYIEVQNPYGVGYIEVFAAQNLISTWDGDNATGDGSKLTDFGWDVTQADGVTPANATFNNYNVSSACRYLPPWTEYTYNENQWTGDRIAFIRWQEASDVFNFSVTLQAGDYIFKGLCTWNTNGRAPVVYTMAINAGKSNTSDTLGIAVNTFNQGFQLADYDFEFTVSKSGTYYVTISSNQAKDVICGVAMLHIYQQQEVSANLLNGKKKNYPICVNNKIITINELKVGADVAIYDVSGRLITQQKTSETYSAKMPYAGCFIVSITENEQKVNKCIIVR